MKKLIGIFSVICLTILKTTQRYLGLKNEEDLKGAVSVLDRLKSSVESVCNGQPMAVSENIISPSHSIS